MITLPSRHTLAFLSVAFLFAAGSESASGQQIQLAGHVSSHGGHHAKHKPKPESTPAPSPGPLSDPDGTWIVDASGNWSSPANWTSVPPGGVADAGGKADFSTINITGNRIITIDTTSRTVRQIDIGDTNSSHSYTIAASGAAKLIFDNTANSANAQLNQVLNSNGDIISAPIVLNSSLNITNASTAALTLSTGGITSGTAGAKTITTSTGTITISGVIGDGSGTVALTQNGPGTLILSGANTYSGATTINGGTLQISGADNRLPTGTALTLANTAGVTFDLNARNQIIGSLSGGGLTGGTVDLSGHTLTVGDSTSTTFAGVLIANGGRLSKVGTGTLTLTGTNSYTGGTTVGAGALFVNNTAGSGTGTGNVAVTNSGTILGGSGTITGAVSVAAGAKLSPGATGVGSTAIFKTGALTLSSGSFFNVDINNATAGTGYDQLRVTGSTAISGSNLVVNTGGGLFGISLGQKFFAVLNDGTDGITGTFAQGSTVTSNNGDVFSINYADNGDGGTSANDISLTLTSVGIPEPGTWAGAALALGALLYSRPRRFSRERKEIGN